MIVVTDLAIRVGAFALNDVSFTVQAREYAVLMGRTGCGKTTLLEAICGLKAVDQGTIELDGIDVTRSKAAERGIGYVPQDLALFSTMTVREHLAFALQIRRWDKVTIDARVAELAALLDITHLLPRRPHGLSGGEQQRVALGRALSFRPRLLLMDEPLSALDDETRAKMYEVLKTAQRHEHVTTLHVTHNIEEANKLADRVLRMDRGQVEDKGLTSAEKNI